MRARSVIPLVLSVLAAVTGPAFLPAHAGNAHAATDVVDYECTGTGGGPQNVQIRVTLTMPENPVAGQEMVIGWQGVYQAGAVTAPDSGLPEDSKLYVYASISGFPGLTSATGVSRLPAVGAGQPIPLPMTIVEMRTTAGSAGTGIVRPAAVNIGTSPQDRLIECEVRNREELTTYQLVVAGSGTPTATSTPTPANTAVNTPTATATSTPTPTLSPTATVTMPRTGRNGVEQTPAGGVETGGGGEAGPDGRMVMLAGFVLFLAGAGGLLLRRRAV